MSRPRNRIAPASGRRWPETALTNVVFPAPFGPMSPTTVRSAAARSTPATATTPPKRLVRPVASSNIGLADAHEAPRATQLEDGHEPARQVDRDQDEDRALEDVAVLPEKAQQLGQRGQEDGAEERAEDVRHAAHDRRHEDLHRRAEA